MKRRIIDFHTHLRDIFHGNQNISFKAPKDYGELHYMMDLIARYPDYILIPAHAGGDCGWEYEQLGKEVNKRGFKNIYTDTTFKNAEVIVRLVELFGEDKILFATDYPFDSIKHSITECEKAFADDPIIADKVFFRNSAKLLHL